MEWQAALDEEIGQNRQHVLGRKVALRHDGQAFLGIFIDDIQHAELPAVVGAVFHEVVAPDMACELRAQLVA